MSDLIKQLQDNLGESEWIDLAPHAARDALIVVHPSLELLIVGEAIAQDNSALVEKWMGSGLLHKPTRAQLERWNQATTLPTFTTLIVQPFVLINGEYADQ